MFSRARGTMKDFGNTLLIWIECFLIYTRIIQHLFGAEHPTVVPAMLHYLSRIIRYSYSYAWSHVGQLAIVWHNHIMTQTQLDPTHWRTVSEEWLSQYINVASLASQGSLKRIKPDLTIKAGASSNLPSKSCKKFNTIHGCDADWCKRSHSCSKCQSKDHPSFKCRK